MREVLAGHVEQGAMPGLIALVVRHGRAQVEVIGTKAFGDTEPMQRDAIFRIASLTKPIAAAAAMVRVDDGILRLVRPWTTCFLSWPIDGY
jgi:CubicO group peptidase (beta-lactamase class C family)